MIYNTLHAFIDDMPSHSQLCEILSAIKGVFFIFFTPLIGGISAHSQLCEVKGRNKKVKAIMQASTGLSPYPITRLENYDG